jgi:glycosyltransferase involved in cell wall biosynthesis
LDQRLFHAGFGLGMITHAALIIAITALERDQIIQRLGVDPKRVVVVPNGVEPPPASADGGSLWPAGRFVLFMGRLAPIKGPDLLLEAFANVSSKFPDVSLVFAGPDFGMRPALEQRVAELGLAHRVRFAGFLDERARWGAYRRAAFLAVPSRAEAMSLVALEAAAAGTPVLISDQCGFNEIRASGGGVVVTADVRGLSGGLSDMLGEGADLCEMGSKLKSFVLETYAWPNVAGKLRDYLSGLTGPRAT